MSFGVIGIKFQGASGRSLRARTVPVINALEISLNGVGLNLGSEEVEVYNTFVVPEGNPTTVNIPNNERRCGSLVPFLTLESNNLCIGSAWTLRANGVPNTSVNLLGTSSGKSWKISEWSKTDSSGTFSAAGVFAAGTEGSHTLRVDIGGLLSNTISLVVSKCAP
jgi:hypothetical protein